MCYRFYAPETSDYMNYKVVPVNTLKTRVNGDGLLYIKYVLFRTYGTVVSALIIATFLSESGFTGLLDWQDKVSIVYYLGTRNRRAPAGHQYINTQRKFR